MSIYDTATLCDPDCGDLIDTLVRLLFPLVGQLERAQARRDQAKRERVVCRHTAVVASKDEDGNTLAICPHCGEKERLADMDMIVVGSWMPITKYRSVKAIEGGVVVKTEMHRVLTTHKVQGCKRCQVRMMYEIGKTEQMNKQRRLDGLRDLEACLEQDQLAVENLPFNTERYRQYQSHQVVKGGASKQGWEAVASDWRMKGEEG
jgi:hypothetical protein